MEESEGGRGGMPTKGEWCNPVSNTLLVPSYDTQGKVGIFYLPPTGGNVIKCKSTPCTSYQIITQTASQTSDDELPLTLVSFRF